MAPSVKISSASANTIAAGAKLLNRLSPEMAVLLLRDFQRANPKFAMEPSYQKFVMDHGDLLG